MKIRSKIFLSLLYSYIVVISINVVVFLIIYRWSYRTNHENAVSRVEMLLDRGRDLVEARLEELEAGALRIAYDSDVSSFARIDGDLSPVDYYSLLGLGREFRTFNLNTSFVDNVYLIFRGSGVVVSTDYANPDIAAFYPHFLRYEEATYDEWAEKYDLWSKIKRFYPLTTISSLGKKNNVLTYRIPVAIGTATPRVVLLALIPDDSLRSCFGQILDEGGGFVLRDAQHTELYRSEPPGNDGRGIRVAVSSLHSGIKYEAHIPDTYVRAISRPVTVMFVGALVAALTAGLLVAAAFAYRDSRPISHIVGMLTGVKRPRVFPSIQRYEWIEGSLKDLIGKTVSIEQALDRQKRLLSLGLLERLLFGGFEDRSELLRYAAEQNVDIPENECRVAVLKVVGWPEGESRSVGQAVLSSYLESRRGRELMIHKTGAGDVLISVDTESFVRRIKAYQQELEVNLGIRTVAVVGHAKSDVLHLDESYREALQVFRTTPETAESSVIRFYEDHRDNHTTYTYSNTAERYITNAALAGDYATLRSFVETVRTANFVETRPATTAVLCLLADISSTVVKTVKAAGAEDSVQPADYISYLDGYRSLDEFFRRAYDLLGQVVELRRTSRKSHNTDLKERILAYVSEGYCDSMFSLESLADNLGLNPQYVSRFFKEHVGESFSSYLEKMRMEYAERLMQNHSLNLGAVGASVGYQHWNSFYRAFKRHHGVSPGTFRSRMEPRPRMVR